jgi:uncharacterized membrane protein YtjA (UPF0391 family)
MLRAAIIFFVLGLVAILLGANNFAGISMEVGKIILFAFLILAAISFLGSLLTGRSGPKSLP